MPARISSAYDPESNRHRGYGRRIRAQVVNQKDNEVPTAWCFVKPEQKTLHLALVAHTDTVELYIDGVLKSEPRELGNVHTKSTHWSKFGIGAGISSNKVIQFFRGSVHALRLSSRDRYDGQFTPTELIDDADTIALYDFSQGEGDVLKDISGHGHDGKIVGATWARAASRVDAEREVSALRFTGQTRVNLPPDLIDGGEFTIDMIVSGLGDHTEEGLQPLWTIDRGEGAGRVRRHLLADLTQWGAKRFHVQHQNASTSQLLSPGVPRGHGRHRLTMLWPDQKPQLYVDGRRVTGEEWSYVHTSRPGEEFFTLGYDGDPTKQGWTGALHEFKVSRGSHPPAESGVPTSLRADADTLTLYHCDEGQGTTLHDASGHGRDVTIENPEWMTPATEEDRARLAAHGLYFDGKDDRVDAVIEKSRPLPLTLEVWLTPEQLQFTAENVNDATHRTLMGLSNGAHLFLVDGLEFENIWGQFQLSKDRFPSIHNGPLRSDALQHVAWVITESSMSLYLDGEQIQKVDGLPEEKESLLKAPLRSNLIIGNFRAPNGNYYNQFRGTMHALRISNSERYTGSFTPGQLTSDPDTIALYDFSQGSGDVLKDISGNGHDGEIHGAKWVNDGPIRAQTASAAIPVLQPLAGVASLVQRPQFIPGLKSWDIVRAMPAGSPNRIERLPDGRFISTWSNRPGIHVHGSDLKVAQVFLSRHVETAGPNGFAVSPKRGLAARYIRKGGIQVLELHSGEAIYELPNIDFGSSYALSFSHSEQKLVAMANALHVLELNGQASPRWKKLNDDVSSTPRSLVWSPDDSELWLATKDRKFAAYREADLEPIVEHPLHDADVCFLDLSPDGTRLLTAQTTGQINVYNVAEWTITQQWKLDPAGEITAAALVPRSVTDRSDRCGSRGNLACC
ncbi:MAG: LamG-like jellyroll fold domain-containing protein [Planctomycetaceae bacterium]